MITPIPTEDEFERLKEILEGAPDNFGRTHKDALIEIGYDPEVRETVAYNDALESHVFLCENCDVWCSPDTRIHNQVASMTVCEECDDNIMGH